MGVAIIKAIASQTTTFRLSIRTISDMDAPFTFLIPISLILSREIKIISPSNPVSASKIVQSETNSIKRAKRSSWL